MMIPQYWAEFRLEASHLRKRAVFRRWGWSDESEQAAQRHAEQRTREAAERWRRGETPLRRERSVPYNGAEGTPIREEIVDRVEDALVTRNSYGALCLNTPGVLFADIDHDEQPPGSLSCLLMLVFAGIALWTTTKRNAVWVATAIVVVFGLVRGLIFARDVFRSYSALRGGPEQMALARIQRFVDAHRGWGVRVYRTPAGLRLLATHRTFDPRSEEVAEFFREVGADRVFAQMCWNQRCFRARLTPKPWRIGLSIPYRSTVRSVWPVASGRMEEREAWVADYDEAREGYAACGYLCTLGTDDVCASVQSVLCYHDEMSGAHQEEPLA